MVRAGMGMQALRRRAEGAAPSFRSIIIVLIALNELRSIIAVSVILYAVFNHQLSWPWLTPLHPTSPPDSLKVWQAPLAARGGTTRGTF
jgi:hypothetical protein